MWQYACAAFTRPFTWKGRSTRKEYWSAFLFYMLIFVPLGTIATFVMLACSINVLNKTQNLQSIIDSPDMLPVWITGGVAGILLLYFICVFLAVGARRLHDIGRSAWWLISYTIICLGWQGLYLYRIYTYLSSINWQLIVAIDDKESREARIEEIIDRINIIYYEGTLGLLYLAVTILGICILVFSVTDSSRGPNKYGPSSKYPLS